MKAWERAREYVVDLLARPEMTQGTRLPTTAQLARDAGVCTATMWRAVTSLASEQMLDVRPGAGIHVGAAARGSSTQPPAAPTRRSCSLRSRAAAAIHTDILSGRFRPGAFLPPAKTLAARYGVCTVTMRRALDELVSMGALTFASRRYAVRSAQTRRHGTVICLHWHDLDMLQALEGEAHRAGLRFVTVPLYPMDALPTALRAAQQATGDATLLGVVTTIMSGNPAQYRTIVRRVGSPGVRLAIIDRGSGALLARLRGGRTVRIITPRNERAMGVDVARHLLSLGHRHILYLSPIHNEPWSQQRLAGLRQTYVNAGPNCSVHPLTGTCTPYGRHARKAFAEEHVATLETLIANSGIAHNILLSQAIKHSRHTISLEAEWRRVQTIQDSLMERAVQLPKVTAWVACNDHVALSALTFLQRKGFDVPERVSVVGFDNSREALSSGLTSYGHDTPALVLTALTHVLGYGSLSERARTSTHIEVAGIIADRSSTTRTPSASPGGPGSLRHVKVPQARTAR